MNKPKFQVSEVFDFEEFDHDEDQAYLLEEDAIEQKGGAHKETQSEEDDPFAAFMADINKMVAKQEAIPEGNEKRTGQKIQMKMGEEDELNQEKYLNSREEQKRGNSVSGSIYFKVQYEGADIFDERGNIDFKKVKEMKKRGIPPLKPVNHAQIEHQEIEKNFYKVHPDIAKMTAEEIEMVKKNLKIRTRGQRVPAPILFFDQLLDLDPIIIARMKKEGYEKPTPIQAQALTCALSGRDVIGVAKTGSGKTLAFLIPMLTHILDQRVLEKNQGPVGLVLAPTRELAYQIEAYYQKFCKRMGVRVLCLVGGSTKYDQWKQLYQGVQIVISTPGTLIEMLRKKALNLWSRCSFLVIDEADQMFKMGFQYQVRMIVAQIRPDRQTLFFSATFKEKIEKFCSDILTDPIKINVESNVQANSDVSQSVLIFQTVQEKNQWLVQSIPSLLKHGLVLVFVNHIKSVLEVASIIETIAPKQQLVQALHGDLIPAQRLLAIEKFKSPKMPCKVLVSTNVASRGLDIHEIKSVINYDAPKDQNDHIHRVGRTGRAGNQEGVAYTLLLRTDRRAAGMLVRNLENAGQVVPQELENLAMEDPRFHQTRITIGIKGFNMKINLRKEQVETNLRKNKIGALAKKANSRSGLGYQEPQKKKYPWEMQPAEMASTAAPTPVKQKGFSINFINENDGDQPRSNFAYTSQIRNFQKSVFESNFVSKSNTQAPQNDTQEKESKQEEKQGPRVTYLQNGQTVTKHVSQIDTSKPDKGESCTEAWKRELKQSQREGNWDRY